MSIKDYIKAIGIKDYIKAIGIKDYIKDKLHETILKMTKVISVYSLKDTFL